MKVSELQTIAKLKGLAPGKMKKQDLIRAIQRGEGNFDCFATAYNQQCDQFGCTWREDCFATARTKLSA